MIDLCNRDMLCNGQAGLCDRKYGNTTFLGSHDSFAVSTSVFARTLSQNFRVRKFADWMIPLLSCEDARSRRAFTVEERSSNVAGTGTYVSAPSAARYLSLTPSEW